MADATATDTRTSNERIVDGADFVQQFWAEAISDRAHYGERPPNTVTTEKLTELGLSAHEAKKAIKLAERSLSEPRKPPDKDSTAAGVGDHGGGEKGGKQGNASGWKNSTRGLTSKVRPSHGGFALVMPTDDAEDAAKYLLRSHVYVPAFDRILPLWASRAEDSMTMAAF
jgi:hypothetical protein